MNQFHWHELVYRPIFTPESIKFTVKPKKSLFPNTRHCHKFSDRGIPWTIAWIPLQNIKPWKLGEYYAIKPNSHTIMKTGHRELELRVTLEEITLHPNDELPATCTTHCKKCRTSVSTTSINERKIMKPDAINRRKVLSNQLFPHEVKNYSAKTSSINHNLATKSKLHTTAHCGYRKSTHLVTTLTSYRYFIIKTLYLLHYDVLSRIRNSPLSPVCEFQIEFCNIFPQYTVRGPWRETEAKRGLIQSQVYDNTFYSDPESFTLDLSINSTKTYRSNTSLKASPSQWSIIISGCW